MRTPMLAALALLALLAPHAAAPTGPAAPPAAPPPAAPAGALDGVYRSVDLEVSAADTTRVYAGVAHRHATFFPDGGFRESQPEDGLDGYDRAAEMRRNPTGWGTWTLSSGRGRVVFPMDPRLDKTPITWPLEVRAGGAVILKGRSYRRLDPCDGLRLQGTYGRRDRNEYARQSITFSADGRFSDQGVLRAAGVMSRSFVPDDGRPGSGTYWIGRSTLRLSYEDGRVKRTFFALHEAATRGDPQLIELNTYVFERR